MTPPMTPITTRPFLALDTSTPMGSVAIVRRASAMTLALDGHGVEILFEQSFTAGRSHSSQLFAALEEALTVVPLRELEAVLVGLGPGSYAGVRIGLSAAVGLAVASGDRQVRLLGIPSMVGLEEGEYVAVGDARQESHYLAHIREGKVVQGPDLYPTAEIAAKLAALEEQGVPRFSAEAVAFESVTVKVPSALRLATLALKGQGVLEATKERPLEPIYLRPPHITTAKKIPKGGSQGSL